MHSQCEEDTMRFSLPPLVALLVAGLGGAPAAAHYNMLLPQAAAVKKGQAVTLLYQWGHPFEHQLFDAPLPRGVLVLAPDGKKTDVSKSLEKITLPAPGSKKVTAYRLRFTPRQRGDFVFILNTDPIWMEAEKEFFQDTVKVVLHVEDQEGWDAEAGQGFEMVPLTRPYGLEPLMVFQAQVKAGKPVAGTLVEIERYNQTPPKELPPDEHMTRTAKTDPNGVVTYTLTDAGWWSLTAQRPGGKMKHKGKDYPIRRRTTLWVWVDKKVLPGLAK
jgi:cobalt/nickel transport protein